MIRRKIPIRIRKEVFDLFESKCSECGESDKQLLQVHHINKNPNDNNLDNLELLCIYCHAYLRHSEKADQMIEWGIEKGIIN